MAQHQPYQKDIIVSKRVVGLTEKGMDKLRTHIKKAGHLEKVSLSAAFEDLLQVVDSQINGPAPDAPWFFAIGAAGTTYPSDFSEHETSDYKEVCLCYYEEDLRFE